LNSRPTPGTSQSNVQNIPPRVPPGSQPLRREVARSVDNLVNLSESVNDHNRGIGRVPNGVSGSFSSLSNPNAFASNPSGRVNRDTRGNGSNSVPTVTNNFVGQHLNGALHNPNLISNFDQLNRPSSNFSQTMNGPSHSNHHLRATEVPKYTGAADSKTPFDFILELEKYRDISRGTEAFMLKEILPISFEGTAYHWYRHEIAMGPFENWQDFKKRFRREFQALGYTEKLNRELEARTQGPNEPLTVFIRVILDYYERLGRVTSEHEMVARILRQMHPEYLTVLHGKDIRTIRELKDSAFQAQDIIKAYRMYQPPPTTLSVEPSLAWHPLDKIRECSGPESNIFALPESEIKTHRVHFSSVDPFTYFHNHSDKKQVTFSDNKMDKTFSTERSVREPAPTPRSPKPSSFTRSESPNRERRMSGESESGSGRLCFNCKSPNHLRVNCPLPRPNSPNSENSKPPSSPRRQ